MFGQGGLRKWDREQVYWITIILSTHETVAGLIQIIALLNAQITFDRSEASVEDPYEDG